jgi:hypothetical protein
LRLWKALTIPLWHLDPLLQSGASPQPFVGSRHFPNL